MVTYALQTVLERQDYQFELELVDKRGRIEAEPVLKTATSRGNPIDNNGGGVIDIISTMLRLILKLRLRVPGPIILDEPGKWIAEAHRYNFMKMLREFSARAETQIIMCTHIGEYVEGADKTIEVTLVDGRSQTRYVGSSSAGTDHTSERTGTDP
jgi:DNA repair exonuclease SbcCD ATPase subunit